MSLGDHLLDGPLRHLTLGVLYVTIALPASAQIYRLPPPDTSSVNYFGTAVALDGERIVVGATGIDQCGPNSGAAYVYEPSGDGTWILDAVLQPDECVENDFFGRAVAVDGDRIVVTAYRPYFSSFRSNSVHVFERDEEGRWNHRFRLDAPGGVREGAFAASIGLSGDRLLVTTSGGRGADSYPGAAYIYERQSDGAWSLSAELEASDDTAGSVFGASCAIDGDVAAVSASTYSRGGAGAVHLFERSPTGSWQERSVFRGIRDFFIPMALDGRRLIVGQRDGGRRGDGLATLYAPDDNGEWRQVARLLPPVPYPSGGFGSGVALSDGHALVVGFDEQLQFDFNIDRVVYVFAPDESGMWVQQQLVDLGETHFGAAVAADGALAVIGAATDGRPGAVYVARLR